MIPTFSNNIANWTLNFDDRGTAGRNQVNPNKLNFDQTSGNCRVLGCSNTFTRMRKSGLCDGHKNHEHDLVLSVIDPTGANISIPAHKDIIDSLLDWAASRNFDLTPFFKDLSFNVLGNVPDVSTLAGKTVHSGVVLPNISVINNQVIETIHRTFDINNNSSYQPLVTRNLSIPAIVLAYILGGLLICEEANRGDRWFNRVVRKEEHKTTMLGGAMAIAYFATRVFPWGVELGEARRHLTL